MLYIIPVDSEETSDSKRSCSRADAVSRADVRLSASSVAVTPPRIGSSEIRHVGREIPTCDDVATTTSVSRLSALPPATPHRGALNQATVTRANSLRSDRRSGLSNVVKRHSTSSVTTSPSSGCHDGTRHQPRRSALAPPTCSTSSLDVHRLIIYTVVHKKTRHPTIVHIFAK